MEGTYCTITSEGIKFVLCLPFLSATILWVTGHLFNATINMSEDVFGFGIGDELDQWGEAMQVITNDHV